MLEPLQAKLESADAAAVALTLMGLDKGIVAGKITERMLRASRVPSMVLELLFSPSSVVVDTACRCIVAV